MRKVISDFFASKSAATSIEYGLIAALLSVAIISGVSLVGGTMGDIYEEVKDAVVAANEP